MASHHHILDRRCWIFDLDGTLTLPVHDFAAIRAELGMAESDPDIIQFLASLPAVEAVKKHARLFEIEYELVARTAAAPKPHPAGIAKLLDAWRSAPDDGGGLPLRPPGGARRRHRHHPCGPQRRLPLAELADLAAANLEELAQGLTDAVPVPAS